MELSKNVGEGVIFALQGFNIFNFILLYRFVWICNHEKWTTLRARNARTARSCRIVKKTQYHSDFLLLIPDVPSYTQMPVLFLFSGRNRATLDLFLDGSPEMMRRWKRKNTPHKTVFSLGSFSVVPFSGQAILVVFGAFLQASAREKKDDTLAFRGHCADSVGSDTISCAVLLAEPRTSRVQVFGNSW